MHILAYFKRLRNTFFTLIRATRRISSALQDTYRQRIINAEGTQPSPWRVLAMEKAEKIRMNLQVSSELNEVLERIADDTGSNRSEVIRQALALMKVAHEAK